MNVKLDELEVQRVDSVKALRQNLERESQLQQEEHRRRMVVLDNEFKSRVGTLKR